MAPMAAAAAAGLLVKRPAAAPSNRAQSRKNSFASDDGSDGAAWVTRTVTTPMPAARMIAATMVIARRTRDSQRMRRWPVKTRGRLRRPPV